MSPLDYPNLEVLGLDPPWVEGTGGSAEEAEPKAKAAKTSKTAKDPEPEAEDEEA